MKILLFFKTINHLLHSRSSPQPDPVPQPPSPHTQSLLTDRDSVDESDRKWASLQQITGSEQFISKYEQKCGGGGGVVCKLMRAMKVYWAVMVGLTILTMAAILSESFFIRYLSENMHERPIWYLGLLLLGYKIATSLIFVFSDYCSIALGVRMQTLTLLNLVKTAKTHHSSPLHSGGLLTLLEDDCERLINLPYASTNSLIKIIEVFVLCGFLMERMHQHRFTVGIAYALFVGATMLLTGWSLWATGEMMKHKEKRLDFNSPDPSIILEEREKELSKIRNLMAIDALGVVIPWMLNTFLIVFIYGLNDLNSQDRYWVLIIFGLLRISTSGLGYNMNLLGQIHVGISRISAFLRNSQDDPIPQRQVVIPPVAAVATIDGVKPTIFSVISTLSQHVPFLKPTLLIFSLLSFSTSYCYAITAKSIVSGESILRPFNLAVLILQVAVPVATLGYMCCISLKMSRIVYDSVLHYLRSGGVLLPQELNRLSGDIRLLDRHFYFFSFEALSHILKIAASITFTLVGLHSVFASVSMGCLMLALSYALTLSFSKFMQLRKEIYRMEALSKGRLLQSLSEGGEEWRTSCKAIFEFKIFGYSVEMTFIGGMYATMAIVSAVFMVLILWLADSSNAAVMVMLMVQLDGQLLMVFIQCIQLEINVAAIGRCLSLVKKLLR